MVIAKKNDDRNKKNNGSITVKGDLLLNNMMIATQIL
jgi:hypothetical protein